MTTNERNNGRKPRGRRTTSNLRTANQDALGQSYRFAYCIQPKKDGDSSRLLQPQNLRDCEAAATLNAVLLERGYRQGRVLINYPGSPNAPTPEFDDSFLTKKDIILMTTRAPLDDTQEPAMKARIPRSYTNLENKVLGVLRSRYFSYCNRLHITLTDDVVRSSPPAVGQRRNILFRQRCGPWYDRYCNGDTNWQSPELRETTAAYMVYEPEIWPEGPGLMLAFGVNGAITLGWAYLLRTRYAHLVGKPGFVMAEIVAPELPRRFYDLSFVDSWDVELLTGLEEPVRVRSQVVAPPTSRSSMPGMASSSPSAMSPCP